MGERYGYARATTVYIYDERKTGALAPAGNSVWQVSMSVYFYAKISTYRFLPERTASRAWRLCECALGKLDIRVSHSTGNRFKSSLKTILCYSLYLHSPEIRLCEPSIFLKLQVWLYKVTKKYYYWYLFMLGDYYVSTLFLDFIVDHILFLYMK